MQNWISYWNVLKDGYARRATNLHKEPIWNPYFDTFQVPVENFVFVMVRNFVVNVETKIRITAVITAGSKFEKEVKMNNPLSKSIPLIM